MDRVAVVVGGASGIGAACARAMADDGCTVVVADLGEAADVVCDVTSEEAVTALFDGVVATHGQVDVVVNSAGTSTLAAVVDHDLGEWRQELVDVCLTGAFLVIKHAGRVLGEGGSITSITSLNARQPGGGLAAYCSAKAGLAMLTQVRAPPSSWRLERSGSTPSPPGSSSPRSRRRPWTSTASRTTLGRSGTPEEVAEAVVFCSRAAWLTGEVMDLNGGARLMRYPDLLGHVSRALG